MNRHGFEQRPTKDRTTKSEWTNIAQNKCQTWTQQALTPHKTFSFDQIYKFEF